MLESGPARLIAGGRFRYVTTSAPAVGSEVTVEVTATDWPENVTTRSVPWIIPARG